MFPCIFSLDGFSRREAACGVRVVHHHAGCLRRLIAKIPSFLPGAVQVQSVDPLSAAELPETEELISLRHLPPVLLPPLSPESLHALGDCATLDGSESASVSPSSVSDHGH
jgi:hypothetical protein